MRPTCLRRTGIAAVAGGLLVVSGFPPLTFGGTASSPLKVVDHKRVGNLVEVTLLNPGTLAVTGSVVIEVSTDGGRDWVVFPFTVWGGQKISLELTSPVPEDQTGPVRIIVDDGAPI
jgi:hypothetical protein